jgi:cell division septal protein FtsQ
MTVAARIDPRLRARRASVLRQQGRRRLRILLGITAVLGLVAAGWLAVQSPLLDIERAAIVERGPAAWARRGTGPVALVDSAGRVVSEAVDPPAGLPEAVGLDRVPAVGGVVAPRRSVEVVERLPVALRERTTGIMTLGGQVSLRLDDGVEIRMGSPRQAAEKARTALAVLDASAGRPIAYVDVRVPATPVTG